MNGRSVVENATPEVRNIPRTTPTTVQLQICFQSSTRCCTIITMPVACHFAIFLPSPCLGASGYNTGSEQLMADLAIPSQHHWRCRWTVRPLEPVVCTSADSFDGRTNPQAGNSRRRGIRLG